MDHDLPKWLMPEEPRDTCAISVDGRIVIDKICEWFTRRFHHKEQIRRDNVLILPRTAPWDATYTFRRDGEVLAQKTIMVPKELSECSLCYAVSHPIPARLCLPKDAIFYLKLYFIGSSKKPKHAEINFWENYQQCHQVPHNHYKIFFAFLQILCTLCCGILEPNQCTRSTGSHQRLIICSLSPCKRNIQVWETHFEITNLKVHNALVIWRHEPCIMLEPSTQPQWSDRQR